MYKIGNITNGSGNASGAGVGRVENNFLFTSESVTEGHPDKVADYISDCVLDAYLAKDPRAKVACETLVTTGSVLLAGETSTVSQEKIKIDELVQKAIRDIGYDRPQEGFSADTCEIVNKIHSQSQDIAMGVEKGSEIGAGDQGMMFGFACTETPELMPLCISLAHKITQSLALKRKSKEIAWLRPDGKAQVTVEYKDGVPYRIDTIVVSTQHLEGVGHSEIFQRVKEEIVEGLLPKDLIKGEIKYHINPTGNFVIGGPHGDTGLTGRKIIVDTYGGYAPHGGGAFSGKDPTKVDRSAAYMARYIAKNIVASGVATTALIQLAYAIGVADPISVMIDCQGTNTVDMLKIKKVVRDIFPLKPAEIIDALKLREPNYKKSTNYGHFGRENASLTWEMTDKAAEIKNLLF